MKFIISLLMVISTASSFSQTSRGQFMLGGSVNYNQQNQMQYDSVSGVKSQSRYSNYGLSVRTGYFLTDRIVVGVLVNYLNSDYGSENSNSTQIYRNDNKGDFNSVGIFTRYYKPLGNRKFNVFGDLSATYGEGNYLYTTSNNYSGTNSERKEQRKEIRYTVSLSPGITYFFTKNFAVETTFGNIAFSRSENTISSNGTVISSGSTVGFNSNLFFTFNSLFVGFNFYFGGRSSGSVNSNSTGIK